MVWILRKGKKYTYTYGKIKKNKLLMEGWQQIMTVSGWNLSINITADDGT